VCVCVCVSVVGVDVHPAPSTHTAASAPPVPISRCFFFLENSVPIGREWTQPLLLPGPQLVPL
jgi:hypothetical protein